MYNVEDEGVLGDGQENRESDRFNDSQAGNILASENLRLRVSVSEQEVDDAADEGDGGEGDTGENGYEKRVNSGPTRNRLANDVHLSLLAFLRAYIRGKDFGSLL